MGAFFSFASDRDDRSWTFTGTGGTIRDAADMNDPITLLVDDDNGILPTLEFATEFNADFTIVHAGSVALPTGDVAHNYLLSGTFEFLDNSTLEPILTATVTDALLTAVGGKTSWFSAAAIQGSNLGATEVQYVWSGPDEPGYGLLAGDLPDPEDFGFDLTVLNTDGSLPFEGKGLGVGLDASFLPDQPWFSEGSFSGSSVPGPGTLSLLAISLGLCRSRRRG